jgi:hypothetical protein
VTASGRAHASRAAAAMGILRLVIIVSVVSAPALGRGGQEPRPEAPPGASGPGLRELPITQREEPPWVMFDQAARDEKGSCAVHRHPLNVALVPITYGLTPGPGPAFLRAERRLFPNALTRVEGGCLVMNVKEAKVLQCQKCLRAKERWLRARRGR